MSPAKRPEPVPGPVMDLGMLYTHPGEAIEASRQAHQTARMRGNLEDLLLWAWEHGYPPDRVDFCIRSDMGDVLGPGGKPIYCRVTLPAYWIHVWGWALAEPDGLEPDSLPPANVDWSVIIERGCLRDS